MVQVPKDKTDNSREKVSLGSFVVQVARDKTHNSRKEVGLS